MSSRKSEGFYEREKLKFRISVISTEELLILKLMMKARDKDVVDLISLLTDKMQEIDVKTFAHNCRNAAVDGHIRRQMLPFYYGSRSIAEIPSPSSPCSHF